ncbi:DUF4012 domain-containing protein [Candidatus Peregrinibacteria bacterium]|nr:DUF4012 domain-containing protein [Candidatus Peregrinibacteria bacterium]
MPYGYTPYQYGARKSRGSERMSFSVPSSFKKWAMIFVGILAAIGVGFYMMLGDLKFFANHIFGLGFFSKHYVILLQNNYELRPTGGFITGYGTIDTFMGWVTKMEFKNSYDLMTTTYVTPPKAQEEMLKDEWYQGYAFRDANWEPDLRKSVPDVLKFYNDQFPKQTVDGVVTVNFSLIEKLVGELGGVELNGKKLDQRNLFSALEFEVNNIDRHNVEALKNRKNVLGELAAQIKGKAKRHPFITRNVVSEGLRNKDIALWLKDEGLEKKLIEKGWANAMVPVERGDFLAVNLANLGAKKADRYLQKEVHYYADVTKDIPAIAMEVTLRYPGHTSTYGDNYKGYLRVYLPKEASVDSSPVDSAITAENEFRVVGSKIILPAGGKMTLTYLYTLPRTTFLPDQFKLRLIKQSGSATLYNVAVETAEGKLAESAQFQGLENRAVFMGNLQRDLDLSLNWVAEKSPPFPIEQEFEDLTHLRIVWNKPIDPSSALEGASYKITDLNKANPVTDTVQIASIDLREPNVAILEITGATDQNLEQYSVEMKGIKDLAGDSVLPNPKIITIVQRIKAKPAADLNLHLGVVPAPATNPVIP